MLYCANTRTVCCTLTLNRAEKLNALNYESFKALAAASILLRQSDKVGCVVLRGAGRSFCAGNDLDDIGGGRRRTATIRSSSSDTIERLAACRCRSSPSCRAIASPAGSNWRLPPTSSSPARRAKFADTHGKWDLVPVWGMSQRLPRRIGRAKALEMIVHVAHLFRPRRLRRWDSPISASPDAELDDDGRRIS